MFEEEEERLIRNEIEGFRFFRHFRFSFRHDCCGGRCYCPFFVNLVESKDKRKKENEGERLNGVKGEEENEGEILNEVNGEEERERKYLD